MFYSINTCQQKSIYSISEQNAVYKTHLLVKRQYIEYMKIFDLTQRQVFVLFCTLVSNTISVRHAKRGCIGYEDQGQDQPVQPSNLASLYWILCRYKKMNIQPRRLSPDSIHYENTPIQIYRKFHLHKLKNFTLKTLIFFHISAQNIDCGYSLEPPRRGGSNEYPQSMFRAEIRKIMYTPVNPSFTI